MIDVESERTSEGYQNSLENAIRFLKDTEYKYFYAASNDPMGVLREAFNQSIAGTGEHHWFFPGVAGDIADGKTLYERGSMEHLMLKGVIQISGVGAVVAEGDASYLTLIDEIKKLQDNEADREYIRTKFPQYADAPDFFDVEDPTMYDIASNGATSVPVWAYDTIIAAGLAACKITNGTEHFDGPSHHAAIVENEFYGATGFVQIDKSTGSRSKATSRFIFRNIQEMDDASNDTHVLLEEEITYYLLNNEFKESGVPHIFNDGTTVAPPDLTPVKINMNYVGTALLVVGLILSGIIILLSLGFMIWTFIHRKERVVKASQPMFLAIICLGTLMMGSSIIPMSLDDGVISSDGKSIACMAMPWLFVIGFGITFSALFAKTWRVNQLFSNMFRKRVQLRGRDVMAPLVILTASKFCVGN